ncbi:MAG: cyclic nucleotide-binding domain-containing protein [Polyangiaceae bacterium]|nr:cyclic nucleotide-binding domain-containing protein [Polyangiaceae bacterium]
MSDKNAQAPSAPPEDPTAGTLLEAGLVDSVGTIDTVDGVSTARVPESTASAQRGVVCDSRTALSQLAVPALNGHALDVSPESGLARKGECTTIDPPGAHMAPGEIPFEDRYRNDGEIDRGGMGTIHQIFDKVLLRSLAMKTIRADEITPGDLHRFIEEAQINAQLDHPNIVPVHELGVKAEAHGTYFTMKLVRGRTLKSVMRGMHQEDFAARSLMQAVRIMLRVCEAVSFAHNKGVIHRDLKPENIMIGDFGEVYVMDWGVAHILHGTGQRPPGPDSVRVSSSGTGNSASRMIAGTPKYMAPEQAVGDASRLDERTDVYGIGSILYYLLTSQGPNKDLVAAVAGRITPPSEIGAWDSLPPGLVGITMKALSKNNEDRYQSVDELHVALEEFMVGGGWFARRTFAKGELILKAGEQGDEAYIIASGSCEAFKELGGKRVALRNMYAGDVFGEMAVMSDEPRTASVVALEDTEVTVVTRDSLERELGGSNSWAAQFVHALVARFRDVDERYSELLEAQGEGKT